MGQKWHSNPAALIYWCAIVGICCIVIVALLLDFALKVLGKGTITDYLRQNPNMFAYPSACLLMALWILAIHLFLMGE